MTLRNFLIAVTVVAIGVCGWFFLTERPISVSVIGIENNVAVRVYGLGTVEARVISDVGFEASAALIELDADMGDHVTLGQVLARLHSEEQKAKLARVEAGVSAATATLGKAEANVTRMQAVLAQKEAANARQQELVKLKTISAKVAEEAQRDLDVAKADLTVVQSEVAVALAMSNDAKAAVQYERVLLEHHTLHAPFDAVVVERLVEAGTVVSVGKPIFTLMDPESVWVLAYVDEERAGALRRGQNAEVRIRSLPHQVFSGKITRIGIESDRVNEERRVWITCDQCPSEIFLGEQAEVRISVAELSNALLVPENIIAGFDGHNGRIWIAQDGRASQISAIFGYRTENARVELKSELPNDALIIGDPIKGLADGRMVRVKDEVLQ